MALEMPTRKATFDETIDPPTIRLTAENGKGDDRFIIAAYNRIKAAFERATTP